MADTMERSCGFAVEEAPVGDEPVAAENAGGSRLTRRLQHQRPRRRGRGEEWR
jgi:hypothetical protein